MTFLSSYTKAITTSKWDTLDPPQAPKFYDSSDSEKDVSALQYEQDKRAILREIEMKTLSYQDELESGSRDLKAGTSVTQMVDHYRKKLLRRVSMRVDNTFIV